MHMQFHGRQTEITDSLRLRAEEGARKLTEHLPRLNAADVWFDEDGAMKTVEIKLHGPRRKTLVAKAEAKYHEAALTDAIAKLDAQIRKLKSARKRQVHGVELRA